MFLREKKKKTRTQLLGKDPPPCLDFVVLCGAVCYYSKEVPLNAALSKGKDVSQWEETLQKHKARIPLYIIRQ